MIREGRTMRARAATALRGRIGFGRGSPPPRLRTTAGRQNTRSGLHPDLNDPKISGDSDYGVCRGTNPKCYHDWAHEERDPNGPRVLIYTRTAGPRHANLGTASCRPV